jgi:hypothetical protein
MGGVSSSIQQPIMHTQSLHGRHEFEWKREECFMIRKPDPPVMVVVTKEPPGRIKTVSVQILDYDFNR